MPRCSWVIEPRRAARNETEARRHLKRRRDQIGAHNVGARVFKGVEQDRLAFADLLNAVEKDYETKKLSSLPQLKAHLKHVRAFFDGYMALAVTPDRVRDFIGSRRGEGAAEATSPVNSNTSAALSRWPPRRAA